MTIAPEYPQYPQYPEYPEYPEYPQYFSGTATGTAEEEEELSR